MQLKLPQTAIPYVTQTTSNCNTTCKSNYLKLQVVQNKSLRVIGVYHSGTAISHLHDTLNIKPIRDFINLRPNCLLNVHPILIPWANKSEIILQPTWTLYTQPTNKDYRNISCCNQLTIRHSFVFLVFFFTNIIYISLSLTSISRIHS